MATHGAGAVQNSYLLPRAADLRRDPGLLGCTVLAPPRVIAEAELDQALAIVEQFTCLT
jgi:hypothetical protein